MAQSCRHLTDGDSQAPGASCGLLTTSLGRQPSWSLHGLCGCVPNCLPVGRFPEAGSSLQTLFQGGPLSLEPVELPVSPSQGQWPPQTCQVGDSHSGPREHCCPAWSQPQRDVRSRGCCPRGLPGPGVAFVFDTKAPGARPGLVMRIPRSQL